MSNSKLPDNDREIRLKLLDHFRTTRDGDMANVCHVFNVEFNSTHAVPDMKRLWRICHDLSIEGVITFGAPWNGGRPRYVVTPFGEKVLEGGKYTPYDPEGFIAQLRDDIPKIHEVIIRYLDEALACYLRHNLLASSVMIGGASEKALLELIEAYINYLPAGREKDQFEKNVKKKMIKEKFKLLEKKLTDLRGGLSPELGDDLDELLGGIWNLIRRTRNEAGHPTGKQIQRHTVYANLMLFPSYCKRVYDLIEHFNK